MFENVNVGYWQYAVLRAVRTRWLGRGVNAENTNGYFIVVFMKVTNKDTSASTLPSPVLVDSMNREHSSRPTFGAGLRGEDLTISTFNPGALRQGYFVFDVPENAIASNCSERRVPV